LKNIVTYPLVIFLLDYYFSLIFYVLGAIILGLGSVFIQKKMTKLKFCFLKKPKSKRNRFKSIGFSLSFLEKTGSNRFDLVFSILAWFFSSLTLFFYFLVDYKVTLLF